MISNWWTTRAPWRRAVPRQSAPVSPPPMMTTSMPAASTGAASRSPSWTRFESGRYSMAWRIPSNSRPGIGRSRHWVAPQASTTASKSVRSWSTGRSTPTVVLVRNSVPSASIWAKRRSRWRFSILNSGIPYRIRPPIRSARSNTTTLCPALVSCWAAANPAGPEPATATRRPVFSAGTSGTIHPSSHARSTMLTSICLIVTGGSLIPSTQDPSQGAGQSLPVNSGKLLVACRRSMASRQ